MRSHCNNTKHSNQDKSDRRIYLLAAQHNRLFPGGWSDECVQTSQTLHSNTMPGRTARKAANQIWSSVLLDTWSRPILCLFTSLDKPNSVKTPPNFVRFAATETLKQYLSNHRTDIPPKIFPLENFVKNAHYFRWSGTKEVHEKLKIIKHNFTLLKLIMISN